TRTTRSWRNGSRCRAPIRSRPRSPTAASCDRVTRPESLVRCRAPAGRFPAGVSPSRGEALLRGLRLALLFDLVGLVRRLHAALEVADPFSQTLTDLRQATEPEQHDDDDEDDEELGHSEAGHGVRLPESLDPCKGPSVADQAAAGAGGRTALQTAARRGARSALSGSRAR